MRDGRVCQLVILSICFTLIHGKVFTRCQLTRELMKNNFPRTFLSNWVCLVEQESDRSTTTYTEKSTRRKYYGLFQIGSEWCKEGKKGGKCDIPCESLLDDDIQDDSVCALKVFDNEGFKYWNKWVARCKGQPLPDIEKCPDLAVPPPLSSSRSSPPRSSPPRSRRKAVYEKFLDSKPRSLLNFFLI